MSSKFLSLFEFKLKVPPVLHQQVEEYVLDEWAKWCLKSLDKSIEDSKEYPRVFKKVEQSTEKCIKFIKDNLADLTPENLIYVKFLAPEGLMGDTIRFAEFHLVVQKSDRVAGEPRASQAIDAPPKGTVEKGFQCSIFQRPPTKFEIDNPYTAAEAFKVYPARAVKTSSIGQPLISNWSYKKYVMRDIGQVLEGVRGHNREEYVLHDLVAKTANKKKLEQVVKNKSAIKDYTHRFQVNVETLKGWSVSIPQDFDFGENFFLFFEVKTEPSLDIRHDGTTNGWWEPYPHSPHKLGTMAFSLSNGQSSFSRMEDFDKGSNAVKNTIQHEMQHMVQTLLDHIISVKKRGKAAKPAGGPPRRAISPKDYNFYGKPNYSDYEPGDTSPYLSHSLRDVEFHTNLTNSISDIRTTLKRTNPAARGGVFQKLIAAIPSGYEIPETGVQKRMALLKKHAPQKWREYVRILSGQLIRDGLL